MSETHPLYASTPVAIAKPYSSAVITQPSSGARMNNLSGTSGASAPRAPVETGQLWTYYTNDTNFLRKDRPGRWVQVKDGNGQMYRSYPLFSRIPLSTDATEPIRYGDFCIDLDTEDLACPDAIKVIRYLEDVYGVDPGQCRIYLSGKKGVHLELAASILGTQDGHEVLPLAYKRLAIEIQNETGVTIDLSLYNMGTGKPYRQPNVMRDTGTCKRQITYDQLCEISDAQEYRDACSEPGDTWCADDESLNFLLAGKVAHYLEEAEAEYNRVRNQLPLSDGEREALSNDMPDCVAKWSRQKDKVGDVLFNDLMIQLTSYAISAGLTEDEFMNQFGAVIKNYPSTSLKTERDRESNCRNRYRSVSSYGYRFSCGGMCSLRGIDYDCSSCPVKALEAKEDFGQSMQSEPKESMRADHEPVQAVDLFHNLDPQPFPTKLLPDIVAAYAEDQGELIGVDPGVIGMASLAAIAGCIDDRIVIQPKRHDPTWTESARLWVANIGDPSRKKTPGINKALGPVRKIAATWREEYLAEKAEWESECEELLEQDKKAKLPDPPICKRITLGDVTIEKLADVLSKQEPRGVLIDRDELTQWLYGMDAYKGVGGKDRADWLKCYDGGPNQVDRIKRGSIFVENWGVSVIGGIQPDVVRKYAAVTNHDGMLQRFLLYQAAPATPGVDRRPNMAAKDLYNDTLDHIANVDAGSEPVTLSESAHQVREDFSARVFRAISSFPNHHLTSMLGKWDGVFARMLLVYHVFECATQKAYPSSVEVSGDNAQKVADLLWRVLLPQAISFYNGIDQTEDEARALAGLILAKGWTRFTVGRDLGQNMRSWRNLTDFQRDEALERLEAYAWIKSEKGKLNHRGRPTAYIVNPSVHVRFADEAARERSRREEVVAILNELKEAEC